MYTINEIIAVGRVLALRGCGINSPAYDGVIKVAGEYDFIDGITICGNKLGLIQEIKKIL